MNKLVLSLFPGIGLLDRAFEEKGFCVVRGPDILWGGDIRNFHPPKGKFQGVIAGPPCQDFSGLRRTPPTGYGIEMLEQFTRCVTQAQPEWWLMENVARVPTVTELRGHTFAELRHTYVTQRFDINQGWYCDVSRLRHIQFGSKEGRLLDVTRRPMNQVSHGAALANDDRSFRDVARLQGLPDDFDLPPFLVSEKIKAVGNGIPLVLGRVLAQAIIDAYAAGYVTQRRCLCGCGRPVTGRASYDSPACRKRAQRKRDRSVTVTVTDQGHSRGSYG